MLRARPGRQDMCLSARSGACVWKPDRNEATTKSSLDGGMSEQTPHHHITSELTIIKAERKKMASTEQLGFFESMGQKMDQSLHQNVSRDQQVNAKVHFECRGGVNDQDSFGHYKTNASDIYFTYPVKLMLPTHASSSNCQWVYAINYGGGIVSGDNIDVQVGVKDNCCAMLTTQASTKVYHSEEGQVSTQRLEGVVENGSVLAVLQDPVTCFANARYRQTQSFDVSEDSNLVFMDWLTAGRIARGERWDFTSYSSCNTVTYRGTLIYRDAITLEDNQGVSIRQKMGQYNVIASCVLVGRKFSDVGKDVLAKYGGMQDYGVKPNQNITVAVSPIEITVEGEEVPGVIVKFASTSVSLVYSKAEEILKPLFPMLGGNPFQEKH